MIRLKDSKERRSIQSLFFEGEQKCSPELEEIDGIKLVEKRDWKEDWANAFNCIVYVFGRKAKHLIDVEKDINEIDTTTKGYREINNPLQGDLVVYINEELKVQSHIGLYKRKGKVLSKWTYGNVYLHDINKVPSDFGNVVKFFRKKFPGET